MRALLKLLLPLLLAVSGLAGRAQTLSFTPDTHAAHTRADLILSAETARPGDTVLAGVRLKMDEHWHTYWRNSGDSGSPTKIEWHLPAGITAGEVQWPLPEKTVVAGLTSYVYENEVVLLVPLTLASNAPAGPVELDATVFWLECAEICVPGKKDVTATLNVGGETKASVNTTIIESWQNKIPKPTNNLSAHAWWQGKETEDARPLTIEFTPGKTGCADFFPDGDDAYEIQSKTRFSGFEESTQFQITTTVKKFSSNWPTEIHGVLVLTNVFGFEAFQVRLPVAESSAGVPPVHAGKMPALPSQPLWLMLLFAFVGGLILNFMPCVLPVIALKILGFVSQAQSDPRRVRRLGVVYTAGVLVSFLALAVLVIGVQAAGHRAGWGMQFQSPVFLVLLTSLVTLVALNLFGVFEVTLSGRALTEADKLAAKHGAAGAFFNGALATVLATPCTAPFLAPALGFAFAQPAPVIALFFLTAGLGLAAPYLVLSWHPAWLKFLPKPGAWMEKFKIVMGFPMLGTAVWLYDVASAYYGERTWWLGIFLVLLALTAWFFGEFVQRGRTARGLALGTTLVLLLAGYALVLEGQLHWRTAAADAGEQPLKQGAEGIDWQKWSPQAVAEARAAGRPVLVDFTAKWCLTCRANRATAIEIPAVREKLKAINAVALLGDYTHFPDDITEELRRFDRAGVPLVLVYPADAAKPPQVLPALLTPGIVLEALNKAAR